ncbi:hypothetical protein CQA53_00295 [Helicobacter didelphidarum]|uniref:Alpha-1,2-fucosyltransferase n=1 Tax=Helicobacter didelphidarum TaxID=2040648 RepID=A0A3D8ISB5_9HELI|nr:alpha-1,2-fucosyltransferase [Helicobacter didelphidarum]RDU67504.1 hypothetical protein CQA53_00295 [Helicobacter didelphidarum]
MLIVRLDGGLGNQMFQYAFAKKLESKGYEVGIDISWYADKKNTNPTIANFAQNQHATIRNLEISHYNLSLPLLSDFNPYDFFILHDRFYVLRNKINRFLPRPLRMKNYKFFIPDDVKLCKIIQENKPYFPDYAYFSGFYQNLSCIVEPQDISGDFSLKNPLSQANQALKEQIASFQDSVFLHIRRGDYLAFERYIHLTERYYNQALYMMKTKKDSFHVFVFSNDIQWCKEYFIKQLDNTLMQNLTFEFIGNNDEGNAIIDMELMRTCKHGIIANSTFSWWAAYLLKSKDKIIIAPSRFLQDSTIERMKLLYPQEWTLIEV